MRRETLLDIFDSFAERPEDFLVYDDGLRSRRHSYRDVASAAKHFANRLRNAGVHQGDAVLFWAENRAEWVVAFWGCILSGAVIVPVDYRASHDLLHRIQGVARAKLLLVGEEVGDPSIPELLVWRLAGLEWPTNPISFSSPQVKREDVAEILFTSGATAEPKGVIIQHRNVLANVVPVEREVIKYRKYGKPFFPIRFLNLLPLSHMFGQAMATFIPPMLPGVVVFMHGYNPHEIIRQIKTRRVSVLVCVPKILDVLREYVLAVAPEAAEPPLPGTHWLKNWWRYRRVHRLFGWKFWAFIVGAAPLDPELEEFWRRMGFVVIQGYGLTETAPIVSLNHPFHTRKGTVGKAIGGVEIKIAEDGEILVRGENVTSGYLNPDADSAQAFQDGWFHTGDIGALDPDGQLYVKGRKKEMIVTPEGLNVFPEDIERVLNSFPGVRDSAVVGLTQGGKERVHAVLVLDDDVDPDAVTRAANAKLEDHQKVRGATIWPDGALPRTEGTRKLKRRELQRWLARGATATPAQPGPETDIDSLLAHHAPNRQLAPGTTVDELGLSSLERVELLLSIERRFGVTIDESEFSGATTVEQLRKLVTQPQLPAGKQIVVEPVDFPRWNRTKAAHWVRRINLPLWLLPLARIFTWVRVHGLENLDGVEPPVIFAPNHQTHLDLPVLMQALPSKWRYRLAPAMSKEFFRAHFFPAQHSRREWFTNSLNYYLGALVFNAFPFPQREAGARQTMRYAGELAGEGWCIVIFPEGKLTDTGEISPFQPGVGLLASRLNMPVVPVRISGLDKVLHRTWKFPKPGRVDVTFGNPLYLEGEDYAELARRVENAVRSL